MEVPDSLFTIDGVECELARLREQELRLLSAIKATRNAIEMGSRLLLQMVPAERRNLSDVSVADVGRE